MSLKGYFKNLSNVIRVIFELVLGGKSVLENWGHGVLMTWVFTRQGGP